MSCANQWLPNLWRYKPIYQTVGGRTSKMLRFIELLWQEYFNFEENLRMALHPEVNITYWIINISNRNKGNTYQPIIISATISVKANKFIFIFKKHACVSTVMKVVICDL